MAFPLLIPNKLHPITGEDLKPTVETVWQDGVTPMSDELCGGLYNKDTESTSETFGSYFKWNSAGDYPISRLTTVNQSNFQKLINDFGTDSITIIINKNISITGNLSIPINIGLKIEAGAIITQTSGTLTILGNLYAGLTQIFTGAGNFNINVDLVRPEWWGAKGDGVTDDIVAINKAISATKSDVKFGCKVYLIGTPILIKRGVRLIGSGNQDTIVNRSTTIKLKSGANCEMVQTPFIQGDGRTHYMALENIFFDGNGNNQTVENIGINWQGVWITTYIQNIFITDVKGQALSIGNGSDLYINNVWVSGSIIEDTTKYAVEINKDVNSPDLFGLVYIGLLYIENIRNKFPADPRNVPNDRGNGLLIRRANSVNIMDLHLEGVARMVDLQDNDCINIIKLSTAHCGRTDLTDGAIVRQITESASVSVGAMRIYNTEGYAHRRATGNVSNELPDINQGIVPGFPGFKINASNVSRYTLPRTNVLNQLRITRGGTASPQELRIQASNDSTEFAFIKSIGRYIDIGNNYQNGGVDGTVLRLDSPNSNTKDAHFFGNIEADKQLQFTPTTGSFDATNKIGITNITNVGISPAFSRVANSQAGLDTIVTIRRGTTEPNVNASYIGQFWLNTNSGQYYVSVAIGSTTPIDDWKIMRTDTNLRVGAPLDFPNTAANSSSDLTIAVTGAVDRDFVILGAPAPIVGTRYDAFVSAPDTVTVRFTNNTAVAVNPSSFTARILIIK